MTLATASACAIGFTPPAATLVTTCVLPADQNATLEGHWGTVPIPLAFHSGDFNSDEVAAMTAAADTWNTFYKATQQIPEVLDYGGSSPRVSSQASPTDVCAQGLLQGGVFTGNVVIYRDNVWPHTGVNSVMALTSFCTNPSSSSTNPLGNMYMAYIEINFQGFFLQGLKQPDMQTIITHEFGHLLGLFHSCDAGSTTAGKPDCNETDLPAAYNSAVMYPSFGFNSDLTGVQVRDLQSDDEGRANCLYGSVGGK